MKLFVPPSARATTISAERPVLGHLDEKTVVIAFASRKSNMTIREVERWPYRSSLPRSFGHEPERVPNDGVLANRARQQTRPDGLGNHVNGRAVQSSDVTEGLTGSRRIRGVMVGRANST